MLTLSSYLRKLKIGMLEIEERAQELIAKKLRLVYALNTDWNAANELIRLIEHHEIPLIGHTRTEISDIISKEAIIRDLAKRRGIHLDSIELLFKFLIKIMRPFKFLEKALKKELLALKKMNTRLFLEVRNTQEIPAYNRIDKYVRITLHSLYFGQLVTLEEKRVIEQTFSTKQSAILKVASIFLLLIALTRSAFAEPDTFTHKVKSGQNFSAIYQKYKDSTPSYEEVIKANKKADPSFDPNKIKPGQKLVFPLKKGAKAPVQETSKYFHPSDDFSKEKQDILLARVIMGETWRKKTDESSMAAIGYVVLERVKSKKFPNNIHGVITSSKAFSCFNKKDNALKWVKDPETYDAGFWKLCMKIAQAVLAGTLKNPAQGADHYHSDYVDPYWNKDMKYVAKIAGFYFWAPWRQLSKHFNEKEFANKDRAVYVHPELVKRLELLRKLGGNNPIKIIKGFNWLNEKTGETEEEIKLHNAGKAADIIIKKVSLERAAELAKKAGFEVKLYKGHLHVSLK